MELCVKYKNADFSRKSLLCPWGTGKKEAKMGCRRTDTFVMVVVGGGGCNRMVGKQGVGEQF